MSREKQIEEMARVIHDLDKNYKNILPSSLANCIYNHGGTRTAEAVALYNAGYRKLREGENITKNHPVDEFVCEKCGAIFRDTPLIVIDEDDGDEYYYEFAFKFCPRCGMKVKTYE